MHNLLQRGVLLALAPIFCIGTAHADGNGKFFPVAPKGTYLPKLPGDSPSAPTAISLSSLRLKPWDYIGLMSSGVYCALNSGTTCLWSSSELYGVFASNTAKLRPAVGAFWYPGYVAGYSDIAEDFVISGQGARPDPANCTPIRCFIVRVPTGATKLLLSPAAGDRKFHNNYAMPRFGVYVAKPNSYTGAAALTAPRGGALESDGHSERPTSAELSDLQKSLPASSSPCFKSYSAPVVATTPVPAPEYRGWNSEASWKPQSSTYNANNPLLRIHYGADIFAPYLTDLMAPLDGCVSYNKQGNGSVGWGYYVMVSYAVGTARYHVLYAHVLQHEALKAFFGIDTRPRAVRKGEVITKASCTGNAANNPGKKVGSCVYYKTLEKRTDHVHVELLQEVIEAGKTKLKAVDPVKNLGWRIRLPCPLFAPIPAGMRCDKPV